MLILTPFSKKSESWFATISATTIDASVVEAAMWGDKIAFGLLKFDSNTIYNVITLIISLISAIILFYALKIKNFTGFFYAIIFGGALGNLYDRIFFNSVPDFIDLHINNFHWFIFNIADIFITIGVIGLICSEIFLKKNDL